MPSGQNTTHAGISDAKKSVTEKIKEPVLQTQEKDYGSGGNVKRGNCEEIQKIQNNLSKLSSSVAEHYVLAMGRGLRQGQSRIGCLQALEAGDQQWRNPVLQRWPVMITCTVTR